MTADPSYTGSDLRWSASDATDPAFAGLGELVRASAEGIFVVDSNHRYVYANPAGCELLGYPLSGLVGRDVLTDLPAWQRASGHAHFEIARRGELTRGTFVVTRADGSQLHVEAASSVLKLDGEQFIVTFVHDVSERLRQESQAAALAQAAASVAITDSVDGTVQAVAECVLQGTRALGAWVSLHDEENLGTWIGMAGLPDGAQEGIRQADRTTASYARFMQDLMAHRVVVFPEARQQAESSPRTARFAQALKPLPWRAAALAPLTFQGRVIGLLNAIYREDELPTAAEATFIAALAEHAAIAGANARLVAAAEKKISMGERRRLARELHDSVSQDLFGIELGANRARELLENDPARAVRPIEYVLELAKASRAEMRALIFDLRPESLEADGLVMSINRKIEALRVRHGIAAPAVTGEEPEVPLEVKEALYRIALESLQNAVKHANARRVDVTLKTRRTTVVLEIKDDGAGFDTEAAFHGHLGLRSMHERAFEVGGSLDILSSPQKGTSIVVRVPSAATDRRSRERTSRSVDLQSRPPPRRSSLSPNVSAKASIPLTSASARGCCDC